MCKKIKILMSSQNNRTDLFLRWILQLVGLIVEFSDFESVISGLLFAAFLCDCHYLNIAKYTCWTLQGNMPFSDTPTIIHIVLSSKIVTELKTLWLMDIQTSENKSAL